MMDIAELAALLAVLNEKIDRIESEIMRQSQVLEKSEDTIMEKIEESREEITDKIEEEEEEEKEEREEKEDEPREVETVIIQEAPLNVVEPEQIEKKPKRRFI